MKIVYIYTMKLPGDEKKTLKLDHLISNNGREYTRHCELVNYILLYVYVLVQQIVSFKIIFITNVKSRKR